MPTKIQKLNNNATKQKEKSEQDRLLDVYAAPILAAMLGNKENLTDQEIEVLALKALRIARIAIKARTSH